MIFKLPLYGDFSVEDVDDEPVWLVTYTHQDVANFVSLNEIADKTDEDPIMSNLLIGMLGRKKRQEDAKTLKIVHVIDRGSFKK